MLVIRRTYMTHKVSSSIQHKTSIGKFLSNVNKSCPRRNSVLGENFCRFAVRLKLYKDAVLFEPRVDTNELHNKFDNVISKLELKGERESRSLDLPSTGKSLSSSIFKPLDKWRHNAYDEIGSVYSSQNVPESVIGGMIREINYSLIGWYLQRYGMQNTFAFIEWLGVPLSSKSDQQSWPKSPLLREHSHEIQQRLDDLLDDFVGDAILNYSIVRHLFRLPIKLDADELADSSSLLYSNSSLATVSVRNDLYKFLRYTAPEIRDDINSFVALLRRNRFKPVDDIHFLDKNNFVFEVPPIIPNCFEALIAAIYFDSAMDLNAVLNTISHLMRPDIQSACRNNPKNAFVELKSIDSEAYFSSPVTVSSGQVKVTVTLPQFQNKEFSAISRDPVLAKWGAAKSAVIQMKKRRNVFTPRKYDELVGVS